jgi:hypothetical protein
MTGLKTPKHFLAIDWSGRGTAAGQRRYIFIASWCEAGVTLESGYTRNEVCALLLAAAERTPDLVVGLDFAFSFPAWWLREQGCADAFALWQLAATKGERWLRDGCDPFWGRPGQPRPTHHHAPRWRGFRRTDRLFRAKSPFQIGGAGAVGTASIRGMPMLARLHQAGFHLWPFQPAELPLALEIYPRLFTGPVIKSSREARKAYLQQPAYAQLPTEVLAKAADSEDAFDALCSVLGMAAQAKHLTTLTEGEHPEDRLEGAIWHPKPGPPQGPVGRAEETGCPISRAVCEMGNERILTGQF